MLASSLTAGDVRLLARAFRALGDETRLRMIALLGHGELCVCHVEQALDLTQSNASRHLSILRAAGLVEVERRGGWAYYRLAPDTDGTIATVLAAVAERFGKAKVRAEHAAIRRACGPAAGGRP